MRQREPAICLRTTDYSETSQVVHFLTRQAGVVSLLAKGTKRAKSKSGGMIDLLSEGELVFSGAGRESLGTLIEFTETVTRGPLRREAARLNVALYMIELAGAMLGPIDPHPEVFDLLHNALLRIAEEEAPLPAVLAYFQWRLLLHVGLLGELQTCVGCGRDLLGEAEEIDPAELAHGVYFCSGQGGLLCSGCEGAYGEKYRLDAAAIEALSVLRALRTGRRRTLAQAAAAAVNRLLAYHIRHQLGKDLRMMKHVVT